jgi:anti-sigma regulatory factor (Ser/Thr protein kinase)
VQSDVPNGRERPPATNGRQGSSPSDAPDAVLLGRLRVPASRDAPRAARAAIVDWVPASAPRRLVQDAQLLISEVVTNSVEHAGAPVDSLITLSAGRTDGVIWFEVADAGREGAPTRRPPRANRGMGLNIVDAVAVQWGTAHGDGTQVWFELAMRAPPACG